MSSFYNASIRAKINCVTLCQVIPSSITFSWSGQSKTATVNQKSKSHASRILHKQDQFETLVVLFAQDFAAFVVAEHNHCSRGRWQRWAIAFSVPKRRQPTDEVFSSCVKWLKFAPNALPASIIMFTFCHCWTITTIYLLNCWQRRRYSALLFWTVCSKHTISSFRLKHSLNVWLVPFSSNKSGAKTCSGGVPVKKKWLTRSQEPAFNVYIAILWVMNGSSNAERVFGLRRPLRPGWTFWPRDLSEKSPPKYPNVSGTAASFQK